MKNYGKYVLDIIVFQDVNGNEKIYSNHEGGMDGTPEDAIELMVTKQTENNNLNNIQQDNTLANKILPKAGETYILPVVVITLVIIAFMSGVIYFNKRKK